MSTRNPKTIATINFKGGVGKTTITWCLGDVISSFSDTKVLLFDLDAQMSLTQAIALNEDTGALYEKFGKWYDSSLKRKKTIFDALDLRMRIETFPLPKIGVFMNRARTYSGKPTKEAQFYLSQVERACEESCKTQQVQAKVFKAWIPDRPGIRRAIADHGVPTELVAPFKSLWQEAVEYLQ